MTDAKPARRKALFLAALLGVFLAVLAAGCSSPAPSPSSGTPTPEQAAFIAAANDCRDANLTVTGVAGTFSYVSSTDCTFTKTLVSLNASESQAMKTMMEGKSMTCTYTKGNFDSRLVTTLVGGMEYCSGDLKDNLAKLIVFTS